MSGRAADVGLMQHRNRLYDNFINSTLKEMSRNFPDVALSEHPVAVQDGLSALREWATK
jgi:hypothetical protein